MRKLVAFLLTGLALYGAYWFAANRLFDEGSYRKQVAFGSVFVPFGWAYALGFLGALVLLVLLYSLLYTALVNRLQGRRKSPWPLFLQGVTHLFLWVLILLVYYPVVQVVAASFDPTNNLFSFRRPDTGFLLVDAKVIPYLPNPSLENYAKLVEGVVLYPYQVALALLAGLALLGVGIVGLLRRLLAPEAWMDFWQGRLLFLMALLVFALALSLSPRQFTGQGTETKFLLWVRNTFLISGLTGLLAVLLTATAGYAFARFRHLPGRYPMLLFFIFVQMFPGFLALVAIYYLLSWLDLLNTFTGLVLAYSGGIISFGTWVYKGYLESISPSLEEAAMVDGATRWQVFTKILLPLSAPMFVFIFLLFVGTYSEFVLANLVLTGVESWNVGVGLRSFTTGQFQTKWGVFAAASVLGSLPILFLFYGFQQYFVSGYTAGAVKE